MVKSAAARSKSTGSMEAPGLPENTLSPFGSFVSLITIDLRGSGNPPFGIPRYPWKYSTTLEGRGGEYKRRGGVIRGEERL